MNKDIYIYFDDRHTNQPLLMGTLSAQQYKGHEVFSFEFTKEWIHNKYCKLIDPDLQLMSGKQFPTDNKPNFGMFLDSSPDRWGRVLLNRRESYRARIAGEPARNLHDSDYLLGVFDESRMGALRMKLSPDGDFLDNDPNYSTPPFTMLRDLENAVVELEKDNDAVDNKWIQMLIAPGSSLGGARPKANVKDTDGSLWIAKFPSKNDTIDVGAWEAVTMKLAELCMINVAPYKTKKLGSKHTTFLTRRFDRTDDGQRIHFVSAMTMLNQTDGKTAGCSYLDLFDQIEKQCCDVKNNIVELWHRIVFNIAVSNCDDHLRNHGFLLTSQGWTLSPAYDLNPSQYGQGLSLNIDYNDNALDYSLAKEIARLIGVSDKEADRYINDTKTTVSQWRSLATSFHISGNEQNMMAKAFNNK